MLQRGDTERDGTGRDGNGSRRETAERDAIPRKSCRVPLGKEGWRPISRQNKQAPRAIIFPAPRRWEIAHTKVCYLRIMTIAIDRVHRLAQEYERQRPCPLTAAMCLPHPLPRFASAGLRCRHFRYGHQVAVNGWVRCSDGGWISRQGR